MPKTVHFANLAQAKEALLTLSALDQFEQHSGPLHEHFLFGALTKEEFGRLHAMHLADHLSALPGG
jgi:hypothetical protein